MNSKLTREQLIEIIETDHVQCGEASYLARMALAAMDNEPVAWTWQHCEHWHVTNCEGHARDLAWDGVKVEPLYRHAQQPVVESEFIPKNLDKALGVVGVALPESKEEFNFQIERWIQRLIDRVIRCADEFKAQPVPAVPESIIPELEQVLDWILNTLPVPTPMTIPNARRLKAVIEACRAAMLQAGNSPEIPDGWVLVPNRLTAENGAKALLSGEFSETKYINCPECFGDDECETCDGSGQIEINVPVTWTTIKAIWAKGAEHLAAAPQEVTSASPIKK